MYELPWDPAVWTCITKLINVPKKIVDIIPNSEFSSSTLSFFKVIFYYIPKIQWADAHPVLFEVGTVMLFILLFTTDSPLSWVLKYTT